MLGWSRPARIWRSVRKRRRTSVGVDAAPHHLDGDLLLELVVVALGQIDGAHAAVADLSLDEIGPDRASVEGRLRHRIRRRGGLVDEPLGLRRFVRRQERLDLAPQPEVASAGPFQEPGAIRGGPFEGLGEHGLDSSPGLSRARPQGAISRCSQARAIVHSRLTVAGDKPMTSAVSSMERPPK